LDDFQLINRKKNSVKNAVKAGIHYTAFAPICSPDKLVLVWPFMCCTPQMHNIRCLQPRSWGSTAQNEWQAKTTLKVLIG